MKDFVRALGHVRTFITGLFPQRFACSMRKIIFVLVFLDERMGTTTPSYSRNLPVRDEGTLELGYKSQLFPLS